jgi:hypothetical protein
MVINLGRRKRTEEQRRMAWLQRRILKAEASPRGRYVKSQLKKRGVDWQSVGGEKFMDFCYQYKRYGKEQFEQELTLRYGSPKPCLHDYVNAIEKSESHIHQLKPIPQWKSIEELDEEAFLKLVSELLEEAEHSNDSGL